MHGDAAKDRDILVASGSIDLEGIESLLCVKP